jgi:uncharacterized protein YndB with AHSA1/START domain
VLLPRYVTGDAIRICAMTQIVVGTDIDCPAERIFDLIVDLGGQSRWLPKSSSFRGTTDVSASPASVGTTYREPGPFGVRNGVVTELERPTSVTFRQPMTIRLGGGTIDIVMRYTLTPRGDSTRVQRSVTLGFPWQLRLLQPLIAREIRRENERTLRALKAYVDGLPG